jgi:hypothetical protein
MYSQFDESVTEMRCETKAFLVEIAADIVRTILTSKVQKQELLERIDSNNFDFYTEEKQDYEPIALNQNLSDSKLEKIILKPYLRAFEVYVSDASKDIKNPLHSKLLQCHYAFKLREALKAPTPIECFTQAKVLFKDLKVRIQLEKGHGFWGWVFQLLGWTKGQQLTKLFDRKSKVLPREDEVKIARKVRRKRR